MIAPTLVTLTALSCFWFYSSPLWTLFGSAQELGTYLTILDSCSLHAPSPIWDHMGAVGRWFVVHPTANNLGFWVPPPDDQAWQVTQFGDFFCALSITSLSPLIPSL